MNRTATILALTLMLLTGLVLGQIRSLGSPRHTTLTGTDSNAALIAEQFHSAVNTLLETGDPSNLRAMLHPTFIDHPANGEGPETASDLESGLLALHNAFPDLRLDPSSTIPGGDLVASTLRVTGNVRGMLSGIAVETPVSIPDLELLRVADGMVLERWESSVLPEPPAVEVLATLPVDRRSIARAVQLERITLEPSSNRTLSDNKGTIILVESGSVQVHLSTVGQHMLSGMPWTPSTGDPLSAGDALLIPSGAPYRLETTRQQTASILQVRIATLLVDQPVRTPDRQEIAPGVTREMLAYGAMIRPDAGPLDLRMHRVQIGAGVSISRHNVGEAELLLVLDGEIEVVVHQGTIELLTEQGTASHQQGSLNFQATQGMAAHPGTEVSYRANGRSGAAMLLITFAPVEHEG